MIDCASAFETHADRQTSGPHKAHIRAAEKRVAAFAVQPPQFSFWRTERPEELLAGSCAEQAQDLVAFLGAMSIDNGASLVEHARAGTWPSADADTKFVLLGLIDGAFGALREKHCLAPFDDALPGEPPSAFLKICEVLA